MADGVYRFMYTSSVISICLGVFVLTVSQILISELEEAVSHNVTHNATVHKFCIWQRHKTDNEDWKNWENMDWRISLDTRYTSAERWLKIWVKMPSSAEKYSAIRAFLKEECVHIVCLLLLHSKTISYPGQYLQYNTHVWATDMDYLFHVSVRMCVVMSRHYSHFIIKSAGKIKGSFSPHWIADR